MNSPPTVHVVDDDPGMRNSLQQLLDSASLPARTYPSAREFLDEADMRSSGCLVLDLRMPGMGGMELLQRMESDGNDMPVIIISGHVDVKTTVRSMKLGAVDVLQKPVEPDVLVIAIRRAIQQSADMQHRRAQTDVIRRRLQSLTQRELDLLKLMVAGKSNKQMAADLGISIKTVANHRASLMAKTQALNAADLARMSTTAGIVSGR
jgi:two-component system response regulator FixJ